nr:transmembrane protein 60 isoform X1 [Anser cygnoides]
MKAEPQPIGRGQPRRDGPACKQSGGGRALSRAPSERANDSAGQRDERPRCPMAGRDAARSCVRPAGPGRDGTGRAATGPAPAESCKELTAFLVLHPAFDIASSQKNWFRLVPNLHPSSNPNVFLGWLPPAGSLQIPSCFANKTWSSALCDQTFITTPAASPAVGL